jgi:predicted MFS family arabinose efflux permease
VLFALLQRWFATWRTYHVLPFALAVVFVVIAVLPHGSAWLGVLTFGAAGLACSALLPLTISFGQEQLTVISASIAGGVIAFYQLGYGIAAFGAGPLQEAGIALPIIFGVSAGAALVLGGFAFAVARGHPAPPRLHPRP